MFVHKRGQILANLRNQLIEFKHVDHIVETELNIKVKKFISTPNTKCLDELITFDSCVKKSIIHQLQGQCLHLFWNQPENSSSCNNSTSNQAALNIFQTSLSLLPNSEMFENEMKKNRKLKIIYFLSYFFFFVSN